MYLARNLDNVLLEWYRTTPRKPLVLRGARQTGKSTSVREFAKHAPLFLELNLERFEDKALALYSRSPAELLQALQVRHNQGVLPRDTVLFLDEIQALPHLTGWLRFLAEDYPELAVIAAGSLLEVRMAAKGFSFPVGRVTFRMLRPLSFLEFCRASGKSVLVDVIESSLREPRLLGPNVHSAAMELLRDYLVVGGMPEAVSAWTGNRNVMQVRRVHADLMQAFAEDIQKYEGDVLALESAFRSLPHHYGCRFKYEGFTQDLGGRRAKVALDRLEAAELIHRAVPTTSLSLPFRVKERAAPKLVSLDIGMALSRLGVGPETARTASLNSLLDGRVAECLVGQLLLASESCEPDSLHFWVRDRPTGAAETDYLLPTASGLLPVEVKSGKAGSLKSLQQFLLESGTHIGIRLNSAEPLDEPCRTATPSGPLEFQLLSRPLYLAELLRRL